MKVVFLESAAQDLMWFRHYYRAIFPGGGPKAGEHFKAAIRTVSANPFADHPNDTWSDVRELTIPRTPFVLIYRVTDTQIEILRLWDARRGGEA
jgi:addiction module RelE/StbE family toxin